MPERSDTHGAVAIRAVARIAVAFEPSAAGCCPMGGDEFHLSGVLRDELTRNDLDDPDRAEALDTAVRAVLDACDETDTGYSWQWVHLRRARPPGPRRRTSRQGQQRVTLDAECELLASGRD